ncbi:MAG TPA: ABC transporter ATP-binding protein [Mycobacteriales bacterium]|jgi:branched-chain amino acid transport system ATP-binding protein|nr:ABC transporter ATP-binding protein [Mycobacteriales bacterium]
MTDASPVLVAAGLTVRHGQLTALHEVSIDVTPGEVLAVVGANGAGKSTLLRTLAGLHKPAAGTVTLDGEDITALHTDKRVGKGVVLVPEGRRLFPSMTVEENLQVGTTNRRAGDWDIDRVFELFPWMRDRRRQKTDHLSGGEQQVIAIGRALVANPRVLLLDEISLGLAPVIVQRIYETLPAMLSDGMAVLIVEQDVAQALRVASRFQCLLEGTATLAGKPTDYTSEQVEAAYFGFGSAAAS